MLFRCRIRLGLFIFSPLNSLVYCIFVFFAIFSIFFIYFQRERVGRAACTMRTVCIVLIVCTLFAIFAIKRLLFSLRFFCKQSRHLLIIYGSKRSEGTLILSTRKFHEVVFDTQLWILTNRQV